MNKTNNKSNLSAWIFVLLSCGFIISIAYKNKTNEIDKANIDFENHISDFRDGIDQEQLIKHEPVDNNQNKIDTKEKVDEIFIVKENIPEKTNNQNDIYVNKIIISKNIDDDENSETYRNPIDAFKTISTLDESVVKEINYYPTLFVWSSVNTENVSLINDEEKFNPINLSMTLKCEDKIIDKLDYSITANTPRWREWIEINIEEIEEDMLNQFWNVEIVDNRNNEVLESRDFKLLNYNTVLEQVSLNIKPDFQIEEKTDLEKDKELWDEQSEGIELFNLNDR